MSKKNKFRNEYKIEIEQCWMDRKAFNQSYYTPYQLITARKYRQGDFGKKITKAFRDLRKLGFYAKQNSACCSGCTMIPEAQEKSGKYVYLTDQDMMNVKEQSYAYVNFHSELEAYQIMAMMIKNDINVIWNGDVKKSLLICNYDLNEEYLDYYKVYMAQRGFDSPRLMMQDAKRDFERGTLNYNFKIFADKDGFFPNGQYVLDLDADKQGYKLSNIDKTHLVHMRDEVPKYFKYFDFDASSFYNYAGLRIDLDGMRG